MTRFVKLPPSKFLQLCIRRLGICELAESGLPIGTLFTSEVPRVRVSEEKKNHVNMQEEAEGLGLWLSLTSLLPLKPILRHTVDI